MSVRRHPAGEKSREAFSPAALGRLPLVREKPNGGAGSVAFGRVSVETDAQSNKVLRGQDGATYGGEGRGGSSRGTVRDPVCPQLVLHIKFSSFY